jgi:hypothetical protein
MGKKKIHATKKMVMRHDPAISPRSRKRRRRRIKEKTRTPLWVFRRKKEHHPWFASAGKNGSCRSVHKCLVTLPAHQGGILFLYCATPYIRDFCEKTP